MTDNEIIKALECCLIPDLEGCDDCPCQDSGCVNVLVANALELIKRQQADIEKLKAERDVFREDNYILVTEGIENARVGAIKEFTEYVCDGRVDNDPVVIAVKCAVKEMTEGKK